ncbi:MAG: metal ABC transporter ATP-binding protein [Bacilli bacterium]|nr:metal ABC transporter ATP-binding protein [Bacilli bacterium]MBQ4254593.1 metal ABC transporter ATP-binding protein [Bacilli bacterium]
MIELQNVTFNFPDKGILEDVSFSMKDGEFVGILGPNGGGKSTFLNLVLGLLKPQKGEIRVSDTNISYISQTTSLNDSSFPATVEEVVSLGLVTNKPKVFLKKAEKKKIKDVLTDLGIYDLRKKLVNELSGGQLQRVKVAKALVNEPTLVVLDEPDSGMDENSHHALIHIINDLHKKNVSILFVSHHPHDLEEADKVYFIEGGKITPHEIHECQEHHHHVAI